MGRYQLSSFFVLGLIVAQAGISMGFIITIANTLADNSEISKNSQTVDPTQTPEFSHLDEPNQITTPKRLARRSTSSSTHPLGHTTGYTSKNSDGQTAERIIIPRSLSHTLDKRRRGFLKQEEAVGFTTHFQKTKTISAPKSVEVTTPSPEHHNVDLVDCNKKSHKIQPYTTNIMTSHPKIQKLDSDNPTLLSRVLANQLIHFSTRKSSNIQVQDRKPNLQVQKSFVRQARPRSYPDAVISGSKERPWTESPKRWEPKGSIPGNPDLVNAWSEPSCAVLWGQPSKVPCILAYKRNMPVVKIQIRVIFCESMER
ncbi:uncharacterized protein MELLADRAFT_108709 [Melampsora larici-populina 98AG31]|uniref:Uncharacterized protein n=1 Tax=Melampsora larici-populina (strain 98AG31 / pathotype 3-4-7) TaxID=747676 RepID=F4RTZ6_MELLP|nr:uncharacterized protein MELLADRAFT_108709 [Melampsora larici-populina 98AG31]EGG04089.1 hypothetical protein MELLADRAFT_108709 [Melampsora larici-populina 98AG31]